MEESKIEMRWNPLLEEWVLISAKRSTRPWQSAETCPFCPGSEETKGDWKVLTLENKYPALSVYAPEVVNESSLYKRAKSYGYSLVVVETRNHEGDLCTLSDEEMRLYISALIEQTKKICSDRKIKYVYPFRNKGKDVGVSIIHPHSQIYALPIIPRRIKKELDSSKKYFLKHKRCLICDILEEEKRGPRVVYENKNFLAYLPFFAQWPLEIHLTPKRHFQRITELTEEEALDLGEALRNITGGYSKLYEGREISYVMAVHQAPCRRNCNYYHFHVEFYPRNREKDRIKFLAGIEIGGGTYTNDSDPELKAKEIKKAIESFISLSKNKKT
ncbi:MAG: galactose-1-phosphate uridylyltransferase [Thermoproteota archaeon]|nr:galactose-1-phosphate uridylyltransferase [Candidatus Brockarchaeota archaeon]MBO3763178.1 galactose-1-phosphate uridylyltransferase [Candidatus Brockarchaeota archaeon]MBO3767925.1 galactose-1-phosphate uridylyltransferase [Candidatus Brockarchaeota archaeon]MBO3800929.1 galactose-1-phosphate uridylyltransferase [Candidatus Brockarchaeota archaeon]